MTELELIELGLYDPEAPNADERLELLNIAFDRGATVDEVRQAIDEDRLHVIAVARVIQGGNERLTLEEAAARAGVDRELGRRIWRAIGLPDPEPDALACTERDVEALTMLVAMMDVLGEEAAFQLARAIGSAMARLADTEVAAVRAISEAPLRAAGGGNVEVAHELERAAELWLPESARVMDVVHRHHLATAARRYSLWGVQPTETSTTDAVVGFVDLVGSTTLAAQLDTSELDAVIRCFEERALEATRRPRARLVKLIGDEALFVAGGVEEAIEIVDELRAEPDLPAMRAGIAAGTVIVREGDVFGPVVNLAARLVAGAEPGQTLLDAEAAHRLGDGRTQSLGTRDLAGFETSIDVHALVRE